MSEMQTMEAQNPMMATPQAEHAWLQQLVGEWLYETEAPGEAGGPPQRITGTERVTALGGLWIILEAEAELPGAGPMKTVMTVGYDPEAKAYTGTFVASMTTWLWLYRDGALDADRRVLTLPSAGPRMDGRPGIVAYQDVIELQDADHRTLSGYVKDEAGGWSRLMTASYRRVK